MLIKLIIDITIQLIILVCYHYNITHMYITNNEYILYDIKILYTLIEHSQNKNDDFDYCTLIQHSLLFATEQKIPCTYM